MRNLLLTLMALIFSAAQLQAQADSIAKATVKITAKNDSYTTYKLVFRFKLGGKFMMPIQKE